MSSKDEEAKAKAKSMVVYNGQLKIHCNNGTIEFESGGFRILRITHLKMPVPRGMSFDIVAVEQLTSLIPLAPQPLAEWIEQRSKPDIYQQDEEMGP